MDRVELAARLAEGNDAERAALLARHAALADIELARALKALYDEAESGDPARAAGAAAALALLAHQTGDPETQALAAWTTGMATLDAGQMEQAIPCLDDAEARFLALGQPHTAAATQVSKLIALAVLGRYDEAVECGLRARDVFLAHGDMLAAGKIEMNLGSIYHRRECYTEAEQFHRAAQERFLQIGDQKSLAQVNNNLANVLALQHKFRAAAQLYEEALERAKIAGLEVTQALVECNLGCLALFQGRYDQALNYLEQSRRRYAELEMPHESAIAEQELADVYLELNLAPEAAAIYARVVPTFAELGMRAEQARALANHGRACVLLGQTTEARALLATARTLYTVENNAVGVAVVTLAKAQIHYTEGNYVVAAELAEQAESPLVEVGSKGRALLAHWLRGEAARALGQTDVAQSLLKATLADADLLGVPQIAYCCHTSLGMLATSEGDAKRAEVAFKNAVTIIEQLRAPLPAEEFRTAFVADKLTAYVELVRLCLANRPPQITEAFDYVERARSRALVEMLGGAVRLDVRPRDDFEADLLAHLEELREDLNWFYSQIYRPRDGETVRGAALMEELHVSAREREAEILEITRQLQQRTGHDRHADLFSSIVPLDLAQLQRDLGPDSALVEYFSLDGDLLAFIVTDAGVEVVRELGNEQQVADIVQQFYFQIGALRYGADSLAEHLQELAERVRYHLGALYDMLIRPLEPHLAARRLVVAPHRGLHYVPFHALYDGAGYLIERREVCYTPGAGVLRYCLEQPRRPLQTALLLGFPDTGMPRVRDEVLALAPLFPEATVLLDEQATVVALREHAPSADLLHLACHGQFRPDSPLFSSLRLADGWFTVRDAYGLDLRCDLVTLSACETGVNQIAPGDELIGLVRGFFAAGAPTLLVSLWTVDDATTATLMRRFYERLCAGERPAAALRAAQRDLLAQHPHPFFWSPFALFGRW